MMPLSARTQQPTMPEVGFLNGESPDSFAHQLAGFRQGLSDTDYTEGQNVAIEFGWARGQSSLLATLAADFVNRRVAVLVTSGSLAAQAAKSASGTIPIAFNVNDAVDMGLAASLNRPGGNATGVNVLAGELGPKRLELLREIVPKAASVAILVNPSGLTATLQLKQLQEAARAVGAKVIL